MEFFLPDGQLLSKIPYRNDLENGTTYYYSKGTLLAEVKYKDGKLDGVIKQYYKHGTLIGE